MNEDTNRVREYYDGAVRQEWERLTRHRIEYEITLRYLRRYIRPGDSVLDIGGGPGRYALTLAEAGCNVTLLDLSPENAAFALARARERGLPLAALAGDARDADRLLDRTFDHVLLMGPLYHLTREEDRTAAVRAALRCLRPGGVLFASFISLYAWVLGAMAGFPGDFWAEDSAAYRRNLLEDRSYTGDAFTKAYFITPGEIPPFMARFPLQKLHLLSQEGILYMCEAQVMAQPEEIVRKWLDLSLAMCEREQFLSFAQHIMYVGRKTQP